MQIIPTAWTLPNVKLILGAGCYIHLPTFRRELDLLNFLEIKWQHRLFIDHRCSFFGDECAEDSKQANRHHKIGATGKGCSKAIANKMSLRGSENMRWFEEQPWFHKDWYERGLKASNFVDTAGLINSILQRGDDVLIEGTQGSLLDFTLGDWPYVTSRQCNASAWLAECGLPPNKYEVDTVLVVRTFPIRVAGNSGTLANEITWPQLARSINSDLESQGLPPFIPDKQVKEFETALADVIQRNWPDAWTIMGKLSMDWATYTPDNRVHWKELISEANACAIKLMEDRSQIPPAFFEKTTVTRKLRRIAKYNPADVDEAILWNHPSRMVVTFLNYKHPADWGITNWDTITDAAKEQVEQMKLYHGVRIDYVTTGPLPQHMITTKDGKRHR